MSYFFGLVSTLVFLCWSQVPPQDQCQLVNATEPPQCPQTIGPPCPPCVVNDEPDYTNGDPLTFTESQISQIIVRMNENLMYWYTQYPPDKVYPLDDPSIVMAGAAGRAFIFLRMYYYTQNSSYINMATEYMNTALRFNPDYQANGYSSFFQGNSGVWTMAIILYDMLNDETNKQTFINKMSDAYQDVMNGINNGLKNSLKYNYNLNDGTLITGLTGFNWNGMFLNEYFKTELINSTMISLITYKVLDLGIAEAQKQNVDYLLYEDPFTSGCYVPGAAAGQGGVIKFLLESSQKYTTDIIDPKSQYYNYIVNTLGWFSTIQLNDGNIPTYWNNPSYTCESHFGNDSDARVQWCHGAPGFIDTFARASVIFSDINSTLSDIYLQMSLSVSNVTWTRGLLIKGLQQCHGIGGNAFQLLHVFKNLNNFNSNKSNYLLKLKNKYGIDNNYFANQSLWRTMQFILWTLPQENIDALRIEYSDQNWSAWWGSYGIPQLYIQAIQNGWVSGEIPVCMLGWDFCFW